MAKELSQALIEQWVSLTKGQFNVKDIWQEIGIISPEGKKHLRTILTRLEEREVIKQLQRGFGNYRVIDSEAPIMDWRSADSGNVVPLKWPFGIEKYALIYPGNVVVLAGCKQEGKSTFLYDFIKLNMYEHRIELFNNETGPEQMKDRFTDLGIPNDAPFEVYERYDNFADVVSLGGITVVDYLDRDSEFYLAGAEINDIFHKKTTGIAVIGMQIPPPSVTYVKGVKKVIERDYAYGGGTTAKRAFIYLSMHSHKLKIKHAKKPAQKRVNPENMTWTYQFDEKGQFTNIQPYHGEESEPNGLL